MNVSAPIMKMEVETQYGTPSSRHDHEKGARPRKRSDDAPGRGWDGVQAGGLAVRSINILFYVCFPSSRFRAPISHGDFSISPRTVMNNAG
jgi:hypothetical protein